MEYSCKKSLYLVMRRFEKIPRRNSFSSPSSQIMAVNFNFTFASSFHDWILRPPCSVPEFLRQIDLPRAKKSISVDCRQLFDDAEKAREFIAGEFKDWPLTSNDRRELTEIVLSRAWGIIEPMYTNCIHDVDFNFRVVETHRHVYGKAPGNTSALLYSGDHGSICPESLLPCSHRI